MPDKTNNKDIKITFRISNFDNLIWQTFLNENNIKNKSQIIRRILFKHILK